MRAFISSGYPIEIKGRGVVRVVQPDGYGDVSWGELTKILNDQEWVQLDCDVVTLAGLESYAIVKDENKKYSFPIGLLIGEVRNN